MRKIGFHKDNFYHIYNRGVDKRNIFMERRDYERFIYSLFECNNSISLYNLSRRFSLVSKNDIEFNAIKRDPIVDVAALCLMPNHFHLLLRPKEDKNISEFMHRVGTSFTNYFNLKYQRSGSLFQGTFKAKFIDNDAYLMHIVRYIHLNPLEFLVQDFKKTGIEDWATANKFLDEYRWSSHHLYAEKDIFSEIVNPSFIKANYFKRPEIYNQFIRQWRVSNDNQVDHLLLD